MDGRRKIGLSSASGYAEHRYPHEMLPNGRIPRDFSRTFFPCKRSKKKTPRGLVARGGTRCPGRLQALGRRLLVLSLRHVFGNADGDLRDLTSTNGDLLAGDDVPTVAGDCDLDRVVVF